MFARLLLLFVLVPLADLILLVMIGRYNFPATIGLVIVSGCVGAYLARRQGLGVGNRIRTRLQQNEMPTQQLIDAGIVLFAAGLLITPGLITDLFGFSLLIPFCRRWYRKRLIAWFKRHFKVETFSLDAGFNHDPNVVDSYVVPRDESDIAHPGLDRESKIG